MRGVGRAIAAAARFARSDARWSRPEPPNEAAWAAAT
ncbi:hypothetical protein MGAST_17605 [Mycobacterium gastri 'Wayne']|nr:hypothetical protein MGAST_17605 [Mycobacterium gastri 'Wayne']